MAASTRIPATGALALLRRDPQTQGPKLFERYCASCHDYGTAAKDGAVDDPGQVQFGARMLYPQVPEAPAAHAAAQKLPPEIARDVQGEPKFSPSGAPNLARFASREWLAGLLDKAKISHQRVEKLLNPQDPAKENNPLAYLRESFDADYFGNTQHAAGAWPITSKTIWRLLRTRPRSKRNSRKSSPHFRPKHNCPRKKNSKQNRPSKRRLLLVQVARQCRPLRTMS